MKAGDIAVNGKKLSDYEVLHKNLNLNNSALTSLDRCPRIVIGHFLCSSNNLASLKGCPKEVTGDFNCTNNSITSLEDGPEIARLNFSCSFNVITSLKGSPIKVGNGFLCGNNNITSLEGCPEEIPGVLNCSNNKITNLHDIHKYLKICNFINITSNPIESHILSLLKVRGLKMVLISDSKISSIINKYLPLGDIFDCQAELIEAGLEEYAKL
jgi:hypothetical protein